MDKGISRHLKKNTYFYSLVLIRTITMHSIVPMSNVLKYIHFVAQIYLKYSALQGNRSKVHPYQSNSPLCTLTEQVIV